MGYPAADETNVRFFSSVNNAGVNQKSPIIPTLVPANLTANLHFESMGSHMQIEIGRGLKPFGAQFTHEIGAVRVGPPAEGGYSICSCIHGIRH
jgi:hypothetical protein